MNAVLYEGNPEMVLREIDAAPVGDHDVLIEIDTATICGTDLHILDGKFEVAPPVVLGHEFSGYVRETGTLVKNCKVGDLVSVEPHIYCGVCKYCRIGKPNLCTDRKAWGIHLNGGFGQFVTARDDTVYTIPAESGITAEDAALAETIGCCLNGIQNARISTGDTVVILGGGAAGILLAELAVLRGAAKLIISEPSTHRREFLSKRGYTRIVDPLNESLKEVVLSMTGGYGADVVIDAAGRKETAEQTVHLLGRGGRAVLFGVVAPGVKIEIEPNYLYANEISLIGSVRNPYVHHQVMEIMPRMNLEGIISHRFPLDQFEDAFRVARGGDGLKVAITPNR